MLVKVHLFERRSPLKSSRLNFGTGPITFQRLPDILLDFSHVTLVDLLNLGGQTVIYILERIEIVVGLVHL